jgi:hypothetical protein
MGFSIRNAKGQINSLFQVEKEVQPVMRFTSVGFMSETSGRWIDYHSGKWGGGFFFSKRTVRGMSNQQHSVTEE